MPLGYPAAGMHLPPFSPRQARTQAGREETRRAGVRAAVGGTRVLHPSMLPYSKFYPFPSCLLLYFHVELLI